jgi:hypothetical protein
MFGNLSSGGDVIQAPKLTVAFASGPLSVLGAVA